jgi:ABC-type amino acid transport system permease subunit
MAIPVIVLVMSLTSKNKKMAEFTKNKAISIFVMIFLFILGVITFVSSGIPLIKDIPMMSSHNFSSIEGTVLKVSISSGKPRIQPYNQG